MIGIITIILTVAFATSIIWYVSLDTIEEEIAKRIRDIASTKGAVKHENCHWSIGNLSFVYFIATKGTLVEIFDEQQEKVIAYVDQSEQYNGSLGINDFKVFYEEQETTKAYVLRKLKEYK